ALLQQIFQSADKVLFVAQFMPQLDDDQAQLIAFAFGRFDPLPFPTHAPLAFLVRLRRRLTDFFEFLKDVLCNLWYNPPAGPVLDRLTLATAYHRSSFHLPHRREGPRSRNRARVDSDYEVLRRCFLNSSQ